MSESSGLTRTVVNPRYALLTPDVFVPSVVQGWKESEVVVNISPAMSGPRFTLLQIALSREGTGEGNTGANEYFIFVTEGTGSILLANKRHRLESGSYIFLPPNTDMQMKSGGVMKVAIFQKRYVPLKSVVAPVAFCFRMNAKCAGLAWRTMMASILSACCQPKNHSTWTRVSSHSSRSTG